MNVGFKKKPFLEVKYLKRKKKELNMNTVYFLHYYL